MNSICAIVVTYNRLTMLKQCITALAAQTTPCDVLVIDNASEDGTGEWLKNVKGISFVRMKENTGGAGGFYEGIQQAVQRGYQYLWLMDDDCEPEAAALEQLMSAAQKLKNRFGFLSSKALWTDGSLCRMNVQRRSLIRSITDFTAPVIPAVMASFVSLLIPAEVVYEVGLPIREFFIWTDDWEYTRRISKRYPGYVITDSRVVHRMKSNLPADVSRDTPERLSRYRLIYRNDVFFFKNQGPVGWIYQTAKLCWHVLRVLIRGKGHRLRRFSVILQGTADGLRFHPQIQYIQRERI